MIFINETGIIGSVINAGSQNLTGSVVASLLLILIFLLVMAMMFGIPLEYTAILVLPLCLGMGAYYSDFMIPIVVILIFIASLITKNWLFK